MSTESPSPRKSLSVRMALIVIVAVALAAQFGADLALFPWSVRLPGGSALVGDWFGEVLTPTGQRQYLSLTLESRTGRCTAPCTRLVATAQLCEPKVEREYDGLGTVENWRGSQFHVTLSPDGAAPADSRGFRLDGTWSRESIQGAISFGAVANRRTASASEAPPGSRADSEQMFPVPVTLRRGTAREFHQACRRL